jgi:hypothetical protein
MEIKIIPQQGTDKNGTRLEKLEKAFVELVEIVKELKSKKIARRIQK